MKIHIKIQQDAFLKWLESILVAIVAKVINEMHFNFIQQPIFLQVHCIVVSLIFEKICEQQVINTGHFCGKAYMYSTHDMQKKNVLKQEAHLY